MGWCIQLPGVSSRSADPPLPEGKARITCFWSWNPRGTWAVGGAVPQHLPSVLVGLVNYVREGSETVPVLLDYGKDIGISGLSYDTGRVMLSTTYAVVQSNDGSDGTRRQIEFGLSSNLGWDIQVQVKTQSGEETPSAEWSSFVGQSPPVIPGAAAPKRLVVRFVHSQLQPGEELVRVKLEIEQTASLSTGGRVRINGKVVPVQSMESVAPLRNLLEGSPGNSATSLAETETTESSRTGSPDGSVTGLQYRKGRDAATARSIASLIRRNYICEFAFQVKVDFRLYFTIAGARTEMAAGRGVERCISAPAKLYRQDSGRVPSGSCLRRCWHLGLVLDNHGSWHTSCLGQDI